MFPHYYIACDLGAESGRIMLGRLEDDLLSVTEIHRFANGPTRLGDSLRWDVLRIFDELKVGLKKVTAREVPALSLSVDSWGVDYALYNDRHKLLSTPYCYRDVRTEEPYQRVISSDAAAVIFEETGIQFMSINTLYHFIAEAELDSDLLALADGFLNIADYLHFLFCGVQRAEESLASTTQIYNPRTHDWSAKIIERFGLSARIFPKIVPSGTKLGPLIPEIAQECGMTNVEVIATCSHDTAAAVAAVPAAQGDGWAFLSSGTWSLIGVELTEPLINEQTREKNYTNEAGFGGTTRFLKNIIGLWILQECRREWLARGNDIDYSEINRLAADAEPLRSLIYPNAIRFAKPGSMPEKIAAYCHETGQPEPETVGQFARCILESLALLYRVSLDEIERLTGRSIHTLHIVGGGGKSELLNQFAANATGRAVVAGPVEATAIGNLLIQAITLGHLASLDALRTTVRNSFPVLTYLPKDASQWQAALTRFSTLKPLN